MTAQNKMKNISPETKWQDMTLGAIVVASGNSADFKTGDWRNKKPKWLQDKCKQCFLCVPVCPDSSIPVKDGKRLEYDYDFCKGCGICAMVCADATFNAIAFVDERE